MNLKIGQKYKLVIDVNNKILTYTAEILSIDIPFIKIKDKFGKEINYNISKIISFEELTT